MAISTEARPGGGAEVRAETTPGADSRRVVLLNFGGPRELAEVGPFLYEILRDPNAIQLSAPRWAQDVFARGITLRRRAETARQYGEIGGRSPIVEDTERIAAALRTALEAAGCPLPVDVAHRYLPGWTAGTAREIAAADPAALLAVPLYPHFCYATSGSSFEQLAGCLDAAGYRGELRALRSYPDHPRYLEALGDRLQTCLDENGLTPDGTLILCSAHGLPAAYVRRGDPYRLELYRTLEPLRARFADWRVALSYQSRVGPAQWLRPYTDELIPRLPAQGVRRLVFVPISFVNDHIETLYEVGQTYFELARAHGMEPFRCDAVSDHPGHVAALCEGVVRWARHEGGVPLEELLPPSQAWRRGRGWLAAAAVAAAIASGWVACG